MKTAATASRLDALVQHTWAKNAFYRERWIAAGLHPAGPSRETLAGFPLITRQQFIEDQLACPPLGRNYTCDQSEFRRFHQSSGTTGTRIYWADTAETWRWVIQCSRELFALAGVSSTDRIFAALPFGSSSGPWIIYEGALSLGAACMTPGNATIDDQAALVTRYKPNVLIGKADHLLRLGEKTSGNLQVSKLILTGQNSLWAIRKELTKVWGAECFDRYGMTEAGSIASECQAHTGCLHVLDTEFVVECFRPCDDVAVDNGESGELVLTTLGRAARPIIRYRTGDFTTVMRNYPCACGRTGDVLIGGVNRITP
ncbi:MAG: phenylacetate--CoA ligase family protein [Limisphaerales bacterium]